jgi:hypothetical protein
MYQTAWPFLLSLWQPVQQYDEQQTHKCSAQMRYMTYFVASYGQPATLRTGHFLHHAEFHQSYPSMLHHA